MSILFRVVSIKNLLTPLIVIWTYKQLCVVLRMKIKFHGELSIPELKQAIFELLQELEDEYLVRHSKNISLHLTPTDGTGDRTYCNNRYGKKIDTIKCYGPYRSITEKYES